ncbi:hypothetical protein H0H93_001480, partial [Arthromyces matolae]
WWGILILGYQYRAYEFFNIHECILRLLRNIQGSLKNHPKEDTARGALEIARRKKVEQRRLATFSPTSPEAPSCSTARPDSDVTKPVVDPQQNPLTQCVPQADRESPSGGSLSPTRPVKRKKDDRL